MNSNSNLNKTTFILNKNRKDKKMRLNVYIIKNIFHCGSEEKIETRNFIHITVGHSE